MSCMRATEIVVFIFLCTLPLPPFALRTWSSLQAVNSSAANVLDIHRQKTADNITVKGKMGRLLLSNQLKRIENSDQSQPMEQKPWKQLRISHIQNDLWNLQPRSLIHKKRSLETNDGFQSDSTGHGEQKNEFVLPPGSDTVDRWLSMRPKVECAGNAMTLRALGRGYTNLLVNREGSSPVSPLQLPPSCGYNMKHTWKDLVLRVSYDGCYIIRENGSYVLPLLWWGRPVKISCQVVSIPELLCSPYGMVLKISAAKEGEQILKAKVEDKRVPLVSSGCAHAMHSPPDELLLFAPYTAACVALKGDQSTIVIVHGGTEFTMACPLHIAAPLPHGFDQLFPPSSSSAPVRQGEPGQKEPSLPPPPTPHVPQTPAPAPSSPSPTPAGSSQFHVPLQHPYSYMGQMFQGYPPLDRKGPSPPPVSTEPPPVPSTSPTAPPPGPGSEKTPPGSSMWPFSHFMLHPYPYMGQMFPTHAHTPQKTPSPSPSLSSSTPAKSSPEFSLDPPMMLHFLPQHPLLFHPYQHHPSLALLLQHPHQSPPPPGHEPSLSPSPVPSEGGPGPGPGPGPSPIPSPGPGPNVWLHHPFWYTFNWPLMSTKASIATTASTPTTPMSKPQASVTVHPPRGHKGPMLYYPPFQAPFPVPVCPPHSQLACYPHPYHYDVTSATTVASRTRPPKLGPPQGMRPSGGKDQSSPTLLDAGMPGSPGVAGPESTSTTSSSPAVPPNLSPLLSCVTGRLVVLLPTAHPGSIQLREAKNSWVSVDSALPQCRYDVRPDVRGLLLSTPLPACHSQQTEDPYILSLPLKFWDVVLGRYRYLDLRCPGTRLPPPTTTTQTTTIGQETVTPPTPSSLPKPEVLCSTQHMTVALPPGPVSAVRVIDLVGNEVKVEDAPVHCGYKLRVGKSGHITIILPYNSCHVTVKENRHTVGLKYQLRDGRKGQDQVSCPHPKPDSGPKCVLPRDQQIACSQSPVSASQCRAMGCCHSPVTGACFYPMDECTGDGHFVFTVPFNIVSPPLNPTSLNAGGNASCPPWRVTNEHALFKIPLDGCGAHKFEVGQTVIYMVEILNTVQAISLNYGTITRESPVRVLVECRYLPGSVVSVGYLVKRPSLGPSIQAQGVFGVQLRIAKDHTYASYYPQYHRPLSLLLGQPLHLEVRLLNPPDPSVVLLVHYCVAYPRSAHSAWVLIYDGCPNPLDPAPKVTPTPPSVEMMPNQTRRFTVSTFQFLTNGNTTDKKDPSHSDEEIYFMCSTEVCSPSDGPCVEGCFNSGGTSKH